MACLAREDETKCIEHRGEDGEAYEIASLVKSWPNLTMSSWISGHLYEPTEPPVKMTAMQRSSSAVISHFLEKGILAVGGGLR